MHEITGIVNYWLWPIFLLAGIACTLIGFQIILRKSEMPIELDDWEARYGNKLKFLGPILIVAGMLKAFGIL
jgi:hypothetical protein